MPALEDLGYAATFAAALQNLARPSLEPARVAGEERDLFHVLTASGPLSAAISGRLRHEALRREDLPAVGDWVAVERDRYGGRATIHHVLPRRSALRRKAADRVAEAQVVAANVDTVFLVNSLNRDFNPRRVERYLVMVWESGARPVVLLNKSDQCGDVDVKLVEMEQAAQGVPVHAISARLGTGLEALADYLPPGHTGAVLGTSGVGKSTIVNHLLGFERQATGEVREDDQRGRHTTTSRELVTTPSGVVLLDSPGMRSVGMWEIDEGLADAFADIEALAQNCRFSDCSHGTEPGCAVQAAIRDGTLPRQRLESQQKLARESAAMAMRLDPQMRAAERAKWKAIHKSVRNHMKIKYGTES